MSKNLFNFLLLALSVALYFLVINPLYKGTGGVWQPEHSVVALREMNKQYDDTIEKAESITKDVEKMRSDYVSITPAEKQKMLTMVPDSIDRVRMLSEMVTLSSRIGMPMTQLSFGEGTTDPSGRGSATISFTTKTTYEKFKEFIDAFENSLRLFSIQSISFSAPKDDEITTFDVRLQTYYMK